MSTDTPQPGGMSSASGADDADTRTADPENTEPTPGSDNDGAEAGYTPPSGTGSGPPPATDGA